jgi:lipoprotein-releasing system ATP-binding protein
MSDKVLETKKLTKYFYDPVKFQVLKEIDMSINHGEFVSIDVIVFTFYNGYGL